MDLDCNYECGGNAEVDQCGVCGGNNECLSINSDNVAFDNKFIQAYPNPFNPEINIRIFSDKSEQISIIVYDISGQKVDEIYKGNLGVGYYDFVWGRDIQTSGNYFIHYTNSNGQFVTKVNLIK